MGKEGYSHAEGWSTSDPFEHAGQSVPALDAVATTDSERKTLVLSLVNRHPVEELVCRIDIAGRALRRPVAAEVLAGDGPDAFNDVDAADRVVPRQVSLDVHDGAVRLPPHSITLCRV